MAIMSRHMKRITAALLSIIFVLGVVVSPALHKAHCGLPCLMVGICHEHHSGGCHDEETPDEHDSDHCPICQLALTPLVVASIVLAPVTAISLSETISFPTVLPHMHQFCNLHFARGPPNA